MADYTSTYTPSLTLTHLLDRPDGKNILWTISHYLTCREVVNTMAMLNKSTYALLRGYPLKLHTLFNNDIYFLDISWYTDYAIVYGNRWSTATFSIVLEQLDSVSVLADTFWTRDHNYNNKDNKDNNKKLSTSSLRSESNLLFKRHTTVTPARDSDYDAQQCVNYIRYVDKIFLNDARHEKYKNKAKYGESHWEGLQKFINLKAVLLKNVNKLFPERLSRLTTNTTETEEDNEMSKEELNEIARCLTNINSMEIKYCEDIDTGNGFQLCTNLVYLSFSYCETMDLQALSGCVSLKHLVLEFCGSLESLRGIEQLQSLKTVEISWCMNLANIEALGRCFNLTHLMIMHCEKLVDVLPLKDCKKLHYLKLETVNTNDLTFLYNMNNLVDLNVNFCPIENELMPFNYNYRLQHLSLSWFPVSVLNGFTYLTELELYECSSLITLDAFATNALLKKFMIRRCGNLTTLEGLEKCDSLETFFISACYSLNDIYSLNYCKKLREVTFRRILLPHSTCLYLLIHYLPLSKNRKTAITSKQRLQCQRVCVTRLFVAERLYPTNLELPKPHRPVKTPTALPRQV